MPRSPFRVGMRSAGAPSLVVEDFDEAIRMARHLAAKGQGWGVVSDATKQLVCVASAEGGIWRFDEPDDTLLKAAMDWTASDEPDVGELLTRRYETKLAEVGFVKDDVLGWRLR